MAPDGTAAIEMLPREAMLAERPSSAPPGGMPESGAGRFVPPHPATPAASPAGRSACLAGVLYSFDAAAALRGAAAAPRRSCWGAAGFSVPPGIEDGFAAAPASKSEIFSLPTRGPALARE